MPLSFEQFEGKGFFDFSSSPSEFEIEIPTLKWCSLGVEPTSVLDTGRSLSPPTSSGTGGGGSADPAAEKCGQLRMEDWEGVFSQEQSFLGDIENPSMGFNNLLQSDTGFRDMEFNGGFGFDTINASNFAPQIPSDFPLSAHNAGIGSLFNQNPNFLPPDENPQLAINHNQAQFRQNPAMFLPSQNSQLQEHYFLHPPPPKRLNSAAPRPPELFFQRPKTADEQITAAQQLQQAAELIETGNLALAQGILARLNHQLSDSIGKPQFRAALYFKEALNLLLRKSSVPPCNLVFKIGAFKSFAEISPILQFSNFTCNQALVEAFDGADKIHIVDFDIGYGVQWASLMQELATRNGNGGSPSVKITAFASPCSNDELELGFTLESLKLFANDIDIELELEVLGVEALNSGSYSTPENHTIAVNLPISQFSSYPSLFLVVLRFVKQLSPKIVVSLDRACDRTDLPFSQHVNHIIQYYSSLLESLEAVNMNFDALQSIERFLIRPDIEQFVLGRHQNPERTSPWKSLFLQIGFSPVQFSNFAESQAECLVQRTPARGFHVEKKQSSLVLCWQRKELVSVSAWRC